MNTSVQTMPLGGNLLTETSTAMAIYTVHSLAALFIIAFFPVAGEYKGSEGIWFAEVSVSIWLFFVAILWSISKPADVYACFWSCVTQKPCS